MTNHRPISHLAFFSKLLEKVVNFTTIYHHTAFMNAINQVFALSTALRQHSSGLSMIFLWPSTLHLHFNSHWHLLSIWHYLLHLTTLCVCYFWNCPVVVHFLLFWPSIIHFYLSTTAPSLTWCSTRFCSWAFTLQHLPSASFSSHYSSSWLYFHCYADEVHFALNRESMK